MGGNVRGMKISGMSHRGSDTINSLQGVVAHWDYRVNTFTENTGGADFLTLWLDQISNRPIVKQSITVGSGLRKMSDGFGGNSGETKTMVTTGLDLLSNQSAMTVYIVARKKIVLAPDSFEFQFGKLLGGLTIHALFGGTRNGNARARYTASYNGLGLGEDTLTLLRFTHYGGAAANNLRITSEITTALFNQSGSNTGAEIYLRNTNGVSCEWSVAKIVVIDHTGLTQTQIDTIEHPKFIDVLKSDPIYAGLNTI